MIPRPDNSPSATDFSFYAYGAELDAKELAESCGLQFDFVGKSFHRPGCSVEVHISPDRLPPTLGEQADLTAAFLERHWPEVCGIVEHPDVETASIRFLMHRPEPCVYASAIHDTRLFELLSRLNVGLIIQVHPPQYLKPVRHPGRGNDDS